MWPWSDWLPMKGSAWSREAGRWSPLHHSTFQISSSTSSHKSNMVTSTIWHDCDVFIPAKHDPQSHITCERPFPPVSCQPPHQVTISTQVVPRDVVARASRDRAQTPLGRQLPRPPSPLHQLQPEPGQLQQHLHHLQPELGRRKREWELWSEKLVSKQRGPGQGGLQPCSQVGTPNFSQPALLSPNHFS